MRVQPWFWMVASAVMTATGTPAFPGAEGFGANAVGGRGGRVIQVTNLNDRGPGSLREAIEAPEPRTIVFRVGGTIELMTELLVTHPYLTIAGQTAPGGGITLKTHPSNSRSALTIARGNHDIVIRYLRSRPGPHEGFPPKADTSEVKDAFQILGARNVILDHCSASWATDEVVSTFYDCQDVTIQWCIIAEALRKSRPDQQLPGKGLLVGSKGGERISVHHNLMIHNPGRNPLIKAGGLVDVVNNVVLAPDKIAMAIDAELGPASANFIGNHVTAPRGENLVHGLAVIGPGPFSLFLRDNIGPFRKGAGPESLFINRTSGDGKPVNSERWLSPDRFEAAPVETVSAAEAIEQVLRHAGCTIPRRDEVDLRLIQDYRDGKTRVVNNPADVGGWPALAPGEAPPDSDLDGMADAWERKNGVDPANPADGNADADGDGFTNLEAYLNSLVPVSG